MPGDRYSKKERRINDALFLLKNSGNIIEITALAKTCKILEGR